VNKSLIIGVTIKLIVSVGVVRELYQMGISRNVTGVDMGSLFTVGMLRDIKMLTVVLASK
jgi:hypothetical protein